MSAPTRIRGPWHHRVLIGCFAALLALLVYSLPPACARCGAEKPFPAERVLNGN